MSLFQGRLFGAKDAEAQRVQREEDGREGAVVRRWRLVRTGVKFFLKGFLRVLCASVPSALRSQDSKYPRPAILKGIAA